MELPVPKPRRAFLFALVSIAGLSGGPAAATASAASTGHPFVCHVHREAARPADATPHPSKAECNRAKKILTEWERLANKLGVKISKKRRDQLRRWTQDGTIEVTDLPAKLRRKFPSELARFDLNQIINICNGLPPGQGRTITV